MHIFLALLTATSSFAQTDNLVKQNGYILSPEDHQTAGRIYQMGYSDNLFKIMRTETANTQKRIKPVYKQEIYDFMKQLSGGQRSIVSRDFFFKKLRQVNIQRRTNPNDYEYNFIRYQITKSGSSYQKMVMTHTQTHETRTVDLSRISALQNLSGRFDALILSADNKLNRFVFVIRDTVGSIQVRFFVVDARSLENKMVYQCRDCFYLLRWYGDNVSGWLRDKSEFWIMSDNSQKDPTHFMRMKFANKDGTDDDQGINPTVTTHSVYRDNQSFSSFDHGLFTPDFQYIIVGSISRKGNFNNIYSSRDGRMIFRGIPTTPNMVGQDYSKYVGNGLFLRFRSKDFKNFTMTSLKCDQTRCTETPVDSGSNLGFLSEYEPLAFSYEFSILGDKIVAPIFRNLRPEVVIYNIKTKQTAVVLPPIASSVYVGPYNPTTNQVSVLGGNLMLENLESVIDLNTNSIVKTTNSSPNPYTDFKASRMTVTSADGTKVPVTLLLPSNVTPSPKTPLMVYCYGEYGTTAVASWMSREHIAPLLKRGFAVAYAHVRGGGDLGETWRQKGTHMLKIKGIEDFEAVIAGLHKARISNPDRTAIKGFSAGGTPMTSVLARHPELVKIVFDEWGLSDAINFVLDDKSFLSGRERMLPIGDPSDSNQFKTIASRSGLHLMPTTIPSRNIIWVTAGESDMQVPPWIPGGYFAKVRKMTQNAFFYSIEKGDHLGYNSNDEMWTHLTNQYSLMEKAFGL